MFISDLMPGDKFTTPDTHGTVYTVISIRSSGHGHVTIEARTPSGIETRFVRRTLSSATRV